MKTHQPCPDCGHNDCLTEFEDGGSFCHSCGASKGGGKREVELSKELTMELRGYRGIDTDVVEFYSILTGLDGEKEVTRVYPYPHAPKTKILPKDFNKNKGFKLSHFFGMDKFNAGSSKTLTIVEGEDDVPSAYQMLGKKWPVIGAPGATSINSLLKNRETYEYVNAFDTIAVVPDNDDDGTGERMAEALSRAFPNKVYRVSLTKHKDANDYLTAGDKSDFLYAWVNRQKYTPENIINTPDQFLSLYNDAPQQLYVPTMIEALDEKIKGIMRGYFTVFKAETGIGKTELMRRIEYNLLQQDVPIASWHLEETKLRSLLGLVSYKAEDNLTQRDIIEDKGKNDEVQELIKELTASENYYQFFMREGDGADELIEQIRYFAEVCDVKYIFIEPIQDVISGFSDASKEQLLADLSVRISKLCAELNIAVVTIAHTNDDGEIKYCRMIGQRAGIIIELQRDRQSEDEEIRNTTYLDIQKNRPSSIEGYGGCLFFDAQTFMITEKVF